MGKDWRKRKNTAEVAAGDGPLTRSKKKAIAAAAPVVAEAAPAPDSGKKQSPAGDGKLQNQGKAEVLQPAAVGGEKKEKPAGVDADAGGDGLMKDSSSPGKEMVDGKNQSSAGDGNGQKQAKTAVIKPAADDGEKKGVSAGIDAGADGDGLKKESSRAGKDTVERKVLLETKTKLQSYQAWVKNAGNRPKVIPKPLQAEVDAFFAPFEKKQADWAKQKYNFDIENEAPLDGGRYVWSKIKEDKP